MTEHDWFQDRIATQLSGGLPDDERARFDVHLIECPDCAREFKATEQTEQTMSTLFAGVVPSPDFEDRLLSRLRHRGPSLRINPFVQRAAIAAAAAIVLGGFGYIANEKIQTGGLDISRLRVVSKLQESESLTTPQSRGEQWNFSGGKPGDTSRGKDAFGYDWFDTSRAAVDKSSRSAIHEEPAFESRLAVDADGDGIADKTLEALPAARVPADDGRLFGLKLKENDNLSRFSNLSTANSTRDTLPQLTAVDDEQRRGEEKTESSESVDRALVNRASGARSISGGVALSRSNTYDDSVNSPAPGAVAADPTITPAKPPARGESTGRPNLGLHFYADSTVSKNSEYYKPADLPAQQNAGNRSGGTTNAPVADLEKLDVRQQLGVDKGIKLGNQIKTQEGRPPVPGFEPAARPNIQLALGDATKQEANVDSAPQPDAPRAPTTQDVIQRKVIRNGDVEFEIDSFDSATMTITKIVAEEGGYVATTNSAKLPNGKVKGTIVVRVTPDHLDTLVLKLRALGDLKSQNLTAQDVTKQYTDTASALRAARAMEERLLDIIKKSQGQIKDLLAAEKELSTWREKIEKMEGELRYYDSLVSLSTLNISLYERDIKTAATAKENENVDMGIEADDVEAQRASAIKAIDEAKGRIVESELKKLDAGQLAAKVVADIPADASGPAIDRLKQLGKIARLEIHKSQVSANGQPLQPGTKLERGDTHLVLSLYNLANVAPRQTNNLNLAATDVEAAYNTIVERVNAANGRVVTSNLNRQTDQQTSGVVQFEVKSTDAEGTLAEIRKTGEVTRLTVAENPDTNNVTVTKRGFNVQIVSLASLQPREVNNRSIASKDVDQSYKSLLDSLRASSARIIVSHVDDQGQGQHNAYVDFETTRTKLDDIEKVLTSVGETYNRSVAASVDAENVTDSKVQFKLAIVPALTLPPRETDALAVEVADVDAAASSFQSAATGAGGRVVDANFTKDERGQTARVIVEVPYSAANQIVAQGKKLGNVRGSQQVTNQQAPAGELARARVEVTLASRDLLVPPEKGFMATLRNGLSTSFAGLMWSLQLIVIGLCLVAPWVFLIWGGVKLIRRSKRKTAPQLAGE